MKLLQYYFPCIVRRFFFSFLPGGTSPLPDIESQSATFPRCLKLSRLLPGQRPLFFPLVSRDFLSTTRDHAPAAVTGNKGLSFRLPLPPERLPPPPKVRISTFSRQLPRNKLIHDILFLLSPQGTFDFFPSLPASFLLLSPYTVATKNEAIRAFFTYVPATSSIVWWNYFFFFPFLISRSVSVPLSPPFFQRLSASSFLPCEKNIDGGGPLPRSRRRHLGNPLEVYPPAPLLQKLPNFPFDAPRRGCSSFPLPLFSQRHALFFLIRPSASKVSCGPP